MSNSPIPFTGAPNRYAQYIPSLPPTRDAADVEILLTSFGSPAQALAEAAKWINELLDEKDQLEKQLKSPQAVTEFCTAALLLSQTPPQSTPIVETDVSVRKPLTTAEIKRLRKAYQAGRKDALQRYRLRLGALRKRRVAPKVADTAASRSRSSASK
jgi:hypothetical protein